MIYEEIVVGKVTMPSALKSYENFITRIYDGVS